MPRIRNWKDLTFLRPSESATYKYIDPLFKGVVNWNLIKTHWLDMMRVVLSIKAGKVMPSTLLRKLGSYSKKNRLYQAFQELGKVVRTMFLLEYISSPKMRTEITAVTNIVEKYHDFLDWVCFGKDGTITENDPIEQEKRFKYLDLVASAVILHNTVDMSLAIQALMARGEPVHQRYIKALSPFITRHIKRYGDYVVNLPPVRNRACQFPSTRLLNVFPYCHYGTSGCHHWQFYHRGNDDVIIGDFAIPSYLHRKWVEYGQFPINRLLENVNYTKHIYLFVI
jgi:hypothetical protein